MSLVAPFRKAKQLLLLILATAAVPSTNIPCCTDSSVKKKLGFGASQVWNGDNFVVVYFQFDRFFDCIMLIRGISLAAWSAGDLVVPHVEIHMKLQW